MDILNENITLDLTQEDDLLPFAGNIKDSFRAIEKILDNYNMSAKKLEVLRNITYIIDYLAEYGNVQEQLIFDTAQLYVLAKYVNIDFSQAKDYFSKYAIDGAQILTLNNEDKDEYLNKVFVNDNYLYLSKIKLADYIFELRYSSPDGLKKNLINEINFVLKNYANKLQKGLLNELITLVG